MALISRVADKQSAISAVNGFLSMVGRDSKSVCFGMVKLCMSFAGIDLSLLDMQHDDVDVDSLKRGLKLMQRSLPKSKLTAGLYAEVVRAVKSTSMLQNLTNDHRVALFIQEIALSFAVSANVDVIQNVSDIALCLSGSVIPAVRLVGTIAVASLAAGLSDYHSTFHDSHLTKKKMNQLKSVTDELIDNLQYRCRDADPFIRYCAYAHAISCISRVKGLTDPYPAIRAVVLKSTELDDTVKDAVFDMCWDEDNACRVGAIQILTAAPEGYLSEDEFQDLANLIWDGNSDVADEALKFIDKHIFAEPGISNFEHGAVALLMVAEFLLQYADNLESLLVGKLVSAILRIPGNTFIVDFDLYFFLILNCDDIAPTPNQRPLRPEEKRGLLLLLCGVARVSDNWRPALAHALLIHGDELILQFFSEPRERELILEILSICPGGGTRGLSRILETTESVKEAETAANALSSDLSILSRVADQIVSSVKIEASPALLLRLAAICKFIDVSGNDFLFVASLLEIVDSALTVEVAQPALRVCVFTAVRLRIAADAETAENLNLLISDCLHLCGKIAGDDNFPDFVKLNACIFGLYLISLNSSTPTPVVLEPLTISSISGFIDRKINSASGSLVDSLISHLYNWDKILSAAYRLDLSNTDGLTEAFILIAALRLSPLSLLLRSGVGRCVFESVGAVSEFSAISRETVGMWFGRMRSIEDWFAFWTCQFSVIADTWLSRGLAVAKNLSSSLASLFPPSSRVEWLKCAIAFIDSHKTQTDFLILLKPWLTSKSPSEERQALCRICASHFSGRPLQAFLSSCRVTITTV